MKNYLKTSKNASTTLLLLELCALKTHMYFGKRRVKHSIKICKCIEVLALLTIVTALEIFTNLRPRYYKATTITVNT